MVVGDAVVVRFATKTKEVGVHVNVCEEDSDESAIA